MELEIMMLNETSQNKKYKYLFLMYADLNIYTRCESIWGVLRDYFCEEGEQWWREGGVVEGCISAEHNNTPLWKWHDEIIILYNKFQLIF